MPDRSSDQKSRPRLAEIIPFPVPLRRKLMNTKSRAEALRVAMRVAVDLESGELCRLCPPEHHDASR